MTRTLLIGALCALIGGASTALAQTSNVFGNSGTTYTFTSTCGRVTFIPPGISDHESLNVVAQQVSCLAKREKRIRNCYRRSFLSFYGDHVRRGHPEGDWLGVDELKRCGSK